MKTFIASAVLLGLSITLPSITIAEDHHHHHGKKELAAAASPTGDSIFNSKSLWQDSSGNEIKLGDFRGTKLIISMAFTSCTYTCPLTVAKLKEIEAALVAKGIVEFKIVLASFDPKRDKPARLAEYFKQKKLTERWVLLAPRSDKDVRELAALLGVVYSQDMKGDFSHSNIISFLDREGVVRSTLDGLAADPQPLIDAVTGG